MGLDIVEIEYETIVRETDDEVVFRIGGKEIEVDRDTLVDFDLEGRMYLNREDAEAFGIA